MKYMEKRTHFIDQRRCVVIQVSHFIFQNYPVLSTTTTDTVFSETTCFTEHPIVIVEIKFFTPGTGDYFKVFK